MTLILSGLLTHEKILVGLMYSSKNIFFIYNYQVANAFKRGRSMNVRINQIARIKYIAALLIVITISACGSRQHAVSKLIGTWEGEASTGFAWCVNYQEAAVIKVITVMPKMLPTGVNEFVDGAEVIHYEGFWELLKGLRLKHNLLPVSKAWVASSGESMALDIAADIQFVTAQYLIKTVNEERLEYRSSGEDDNWFMSSRVESCSAKFTAEQ